jgi:hypothetical protein
MRTLLLMLAVLAAPTATGETIVVTLDCGATCSDEPPATRFDRPLCVEETLHDALIDSAARGDRSALALLRRRYETADTYQERHRLASALLTHLPNADAIWNELAEQASMAIRFAPDEDGAYPLELQQYCEARGLDTDQFWWMSWDALVTAGAHARSRTLLHQALGSSNRDLLMAAVHGFASQGDGSALPAIAAALERFGDQIGLAFLLVTFNTPEADALAFKYLHDDDRIEYLRQREGGVTP